MGAICWVVDAIEWVLRTAVWGAEAGIDLLFGVEDESVEGIAEIERENE